MTVQPHMEVRGVSKATVDLHELGERGSDIRRVSERVRSIYRRSNQHRFQSSGAGQWAPLAPSTVAKKARLGQDPRLLRVTGALERSLTATRAAGQVDRREKTVLRFGTTVPYAGFHSHGKGRRHRDLIELSTSERQQISELISAYVARAEP